MCDFVSRGLVFLSLLLVKFISVQNHTDGLIMTGLWGIVQGSVVEVGGRGVCCKLHRQPSCLIWVQRDTTAPFLTWE